MDHQSLRYLLMSETRDLHMLLDRGIGAFGTMGDYRRYLSGSYAFRAALDPTLGQVRGWEPQLLADDLRQDLNDLDVPLPPVAAAPQLHDAAALAGALYVIEGSALGARLLQRRAAALGLSPTHGARHLQAQTAQQGRWGRFLIWLEANAAAPDRAAASAKAAFGLALTAFELDVQA